MILIRKKEQGWTPVNLTRQQLQNDLHSARAHVEEYRKSELKLIDQINTLRNDQRANHNALAEAYHERDDWRDAFKLIMKLVK